MSFISTFIGWFLSNFTSEDISMMHLFLTLKNACLFSVYIFVFYRVLIKKTIYSLRYNIMLASMVLIVTSVIYCVQFDLGLSAGMLGALVVIRFRTPVKDALDITFLFWAVVTGICVGADLSGLAAVLAGMLTILILILEEVSVKQCKLLFMELNTGANVEQLLEKVKYECKAYKVKKICQKSDGIKIVLEIKCKNEYLFLKTISSLEEIEKISLVHHEGEREY